MAKKKIQTFLNEVLLNLVTEYNELLWPTRFLSGPAILALNTLTQLGSIIKTLWRSYDKCNRPYRSSTDTNFSVVSSEYPFY